MYRNFEELEKSILKSKKKTRIVLCGAHDNLGLKAIAIGRQRGIINGILIGDEPAIVRLLREMGETPANYEIINEPDEIKAANLAIQYVYEGKADIPMKGLMQSTTYLTAIAHPIRGLYPMDGILTEATVFSYPEKNKLLFVTDCALSIHPSFEEKKLIIENIANLTKALEFKKIKIAALSALEKENPDVPSSVDAAKLANLDWGDYIIVQGPLALDNAISMEAAAHKGIGGPVAGQADVLLVPDLVSGNILHKAMHFFAHLPYASVMLGTTSPVVFNSRTDNPEAKYHSILVAIAQKLYQEAMS